MSYRRHIFQRMAVAPPPLLSFLISLFLSFPSFPPLLPLFPLLYTLSSTNKQTYSIKVFNFSKSLKIQNINYFQKYLKLLVYVNSGKDNGVLTRLSYQKFKNQRLYEKSSDRISMHIKKERCFTH